MKGHKLIIRVLSFFIAISCVFCYVSCDKEETESVNSVKSKKEDTYTPTFFFYQEDDNFLDHYVESGIKDISTYKRTINGDRVAFLNTRNSGTECIICNLDMTNDSGKIRLGIKYTQDMEHMVTKSYSMALGDGDTAVLVTSNPALFVAKRTLMEAGHYAVTAEILDPTLQYKIRLIEGTSEVWSVDSTNPAFEGNLTTAPEVAISDAGYVYIVLPKKAGGWCYQISPDGRNIRGIDLGLSAMEENHLAVGGDGLVRLWSNKYESGKCLNTIYTIDDETATIGRKQAFYGGDSSTKLIFAPGSDAYFNYGGGLFGVNDGKYPVRLFDWFELGVAAGKVTVMSIIDAKTVYLIYPDDLSGEYVAGYMRDVPREEYLAYYSEKYGKDAADALSETKEIMIVTSESLRMRGNTDTPSEGDLLVQCARRYNRENMQYKIGIKRVSGNSSTAPGVLMRKMMSGEIPDLVLFASGLQPMNFYGKNLFRDLYGYIDKDEKYNRDAFANCVFDVYEEKDGSLPFLTTDLRFFTLVGNVANIGNKPGWTLEEFLDIAEKLPEDKYLTTAYEGADPRLEVFRSLVASQIGRFVDYDNKTCDFDNDLFKRLLKLVATANIWSGGTYDHDRLANGDTLFLVEEDWDVEQILRGRSAFDGSDYNAIGFPQTGGKSGATINPMMQFGIPKDAENADEAWSFIKYYLDAQSDVWTSIKESDEVAMKMPSSIPCTWEAIEKMFAAAKKTFADVYFYEYIDAETGRHMTKQNFYFRNRIQLKYSHEEQKMVYEEIDIHDAERLREFAANNAKSISKSLKTDDIKDSWVVCEFTEKDEKILRSYLEKPCVPYLDDIKTYNILKEEAEAYFAGVRSLDDTVKYIQDRVTTRITE